MLHNTKKHRAEYLPIALNNMFLKNEGKQGKEFRVLKIFAFKR